MPKTWIEIPTILLLLFLSAGLAAETHQGDTGRDETPYEIVDNKVDGSNMLGWQVFHSNCCVCHGVDATGTDIAPSFVDLPKTMNRREFFTKVLTRCRITLGAGEYSPENPTALQQAMMEDVMKHERATQGELVMPAWEQNPDARPHLQDPYSYLKARFDGALGPG